MEITDFNINITSSQSDVLSDWYESVLGLARNEESGGFIVGGVHIFIDGHSETSGAAKEPHRVLINMSVDDLAAEQARLRGSGRHVHPHAGPRGLGRRDLDVPRPERELPADDRVQPGAVAGGSSGGRPLLRR
jgi:hypothetical protein